MYLFNYSSYVLSFDKKLSELLQVPVDSLILKDYIKSNPITESFGIEMTSFIGAISGNLR